VTVVTVIEIKEVLRVWLRDEIGLRPIAETAGMDREIVRCLSKWRGRPNWSRVGGKEQLTDELLGFLVEMVPAKAPLAEGPSWTPCEAERGRIKSWFDDDGLDLTEVADLPAARALKYVPDFAPVRGQGPWLQAADTGGAGRGRRA
jgi:hypothetical protein